MNEDEIRKFFEGKVKESGYSLESEVENKLKQTYNTQRDVPYLDKDEDKSRSIDFVASTFFPDDAEFKNKPEKMVLGHLNLVIECKSLPDNGWIFFPGTDKQITIPETVSALTPSEPDLRLKFMPVPRT